MRGKSLIYSSNILINRNLNQKTGVPARLARIVRDAHQRNPLLSELYGDPGQELGGGCNGSPGPSGQIRFERASP